MTDKTGPQNSSGVGRRGMLLGTTTAAAAMVRTLRPSSPEPSAPI